jgi:glyoxylase-like metal-dependent hydrolase (beta-lactamase superfamily II)
VTDFGDVRVEAFVTGTWRENCYLVTDRSAGETAVIDPGDEHERLIAHIEEQGQRVRLILCTHAHYDHVGAAVALSRHTQLPCHVHHLDLLLLRRAPLYALSFEQKSIPLPKAVESFDDRAVFELGARVFESASYPGHTPGSTCFRYGNLLFVGDTLLQGKRGRTDLPGGDAAALDASIAALLREFEGDCVLLPGHGEPWTIEEARRWWASQGA